MEAYENDSELTIRVVVKLYYISSQLIVNHCFNNKKYLSDFEISRQKKFDELKRMY